MKKKKEKKDSWWVQAKKQKEDKIEMVKANTSSIQNFMKPDVKSVWKAPGKEPDYCRTPKEYYHKIEDMEFERHAQFEAEYFASPIHDQFYDRLRREIKDLNLSLEKSRDGYGGLKTCYITLEKKFVSSEAKNKSAEKVANWAVTKLLIESIEKSDEINQLERKVKEFKAQKVKGVVSSRLLEIIDKKDHMIRYLMKKLKKE